MITFFKKSDKSRREWEEKVYDECHKRLYNTSLRIVGDPMDAEEVMHDTLIKYFSGNYEFENDQQRNAWLTKVCVRASIDRLRKNKSIDNLGQHVKEESMLDNTNYDASKEKELHLTVEKVKKALERLSAGYRTILSLYLFEGYDYQEIAEITSIQESTVRSQFIRGKARLQQILEEQNIKR